MKKYLLVLFVALLATAVVMAAMLGTSKKAAKSNEKSTVKKEHCIKKRHCPVMDVACY